MPAVLFTCNFDQAFMIDIFMILIEIFTYIQAYIYIHKTLYAYEPVADPGRGGGQKSCWLHVLVCEACEPLISVGSKAHLRFPEALGFWVFLHAFSCLSEHIFS